MIGAKVVGADKLKRKLKHVPSAIEAELREVLFRQAEAVKAAAIAEIEKPKSGRVYTRSRGNGRLTWRASAPGEAPAKKTGQRMRQIVVKKANRKLKPQSRVKAPGIYRLLERGLDRIRPRPLFGPLMKRKAPEVLRAVKIAAGKMSKKTMKR